MASEEWRDALSQFEFRIRKGDQNTEWINENKVGEACRHKICDSSSYFKGYFQYYKKIIQSIVHV
jgi:hypothetical protein